jgi:hypothetical protein
MPRALAKSLFQSRPQLGRHRHTARVHIPEQHPVQPEVVDHTVLVAEAAFVIVEALPPQPGALRVLIAVPVLIVTAVVVSDKKQNAACSHYSTECAELSDT